MINQAKSDKNNDIFLNFVADTPGLRDIKISDNFFLSLIFSELARFSSLQLMEACRGSQKLKLMPRDVTQNTSCFLQMFNVFINE